MPTNDRILGKQGWMEGGRLAAFKISEKMLIRTAIMYSSNLIN